MKMEQLVTPADLRGSNLPVAERAGDLQVVAKDLSIGFGDADILKDVNLELRAGDVVLLHGENGTGKTTLLNLLTGYLAPRRGELRYAIGGRELAYHFPRLPVLDWLRKGPFTPDRLARAGIGRTWQDIRLFAAETVRENVAVAVPGQLGEIPLAGLFRPGTVRRQEEVVNAKARDLLGDVGLGRHEDVQASDVSLGEAKRIAIARAIAGGAKILFLDEPLAGLDPTGRLQIVELLEKLNRDEGITLVIVEHASNQTPFEKLITREWKLEKGRLTEGEYRPAGPKALARRSWLDMLREGGHVVRQEDLPRGARLTRIALASPGERNAAPLLQMGGLVVSRGPHAVVGVDDLGDPVGFSLACYVGEITILEAPNGWGKTTLFDAITGLSPVTRGSIRLDGQPLAGLPAWERVHRGLLGLPANDSIFSSLSVEEILDLTGSLSRDARVAGLGRRLAGALSGGERQRLALATVQRPQVADVLILDEPFAALDVAGVEALVNSLLTRTGQATLILNPLIESLEQ
jgi:ABC-type branched-subunit amino acid transport system ATPase component